MSVLPTVFLLDVDGVMTDGKFYYSADGKVMKVFGPDDHDALLLLKPYLHLHFVTADSRGFNITKARIVEDMKMPLDLVSSSQRVDWLSGKWNPAEVIYMGDGIFDHTIFERVGYAIAPANADAFTKTKAHFVTQNSGGDRAVSEASLHILKHFFNQGR